MIRWLKDPFFLGMLAVAAAFVVFAYGGYMVMFGRDTRYRTHDFKYRLTIDVTTAQGIRSDSTILHVRQGRLYGFQGGINWEQRAVFGEALVFDLGENRKALAVLNKGAWAQLPLYAFRPAIERIRKENRNDRSYGFPDGDYKALLDLPPDSKFEFSGDSQRPSFVYFVDYRNPKTAFDERRKIGYADRYHPKWAVEISRMRVEMLPLDTPMPENTMSQEFPWWDRKGDGAFEAMTTAGRKPRNREEARDYFWNED